MKTTNASSTDRLKVHAEHTERIAYVYVRQSSLRQVRSNLESQRLQYGFGEQAAALGWKQDRIIIVDEDQGRSGALPESRRLRRHRRRSRAARLAS